MSEDQQEPNPFRRLLLAAVAGSVASFFFKLHDVAFPGLPASTVLATKHVPFFQHMVLCGWVALIALLGGGPIVKKTLRRPSLWVAGAIAFTLGTAALQWWFPNY